MRLRRALEDSAKACREPTWLTRPGRRRPTRRTLRALVRTAPIGSPTRASSTATSAFAREKCRRRRLRRRRHLRRRRRRRRRGPAQPSLVLSTPVMATRMRLLMELPTQTRPLDAKTRYTSLCPPVGRWCPLQRQQADGTCWPNPGVPMYWSSTTASRSGGAQEHLERHLLPAGSQQVVVNTRLTVAVFASSSAVRRRRRRRSLGLSQPGRRRHLAIPSALLRARRAMRPQSDLPRLRAIAQPSLPCLDYLQTNALHAARRIPQTTIAFQAGRVEIWCTITHRST